VKEIFFATSNPGKLSEAKKLLKPLDFKVEQLNIPYPEIQGPNLEEVALFGMNWILKDKDFEGNLMLEDAGLFIPSLFDFPGVYSKFVFTSIGCEGILRLLEGKEDRNARFEAVVAYCGDNGEPMIFKGMVEGTISFESKGEHGFGYDPIFVPKGENRTFAEMETEEKNRFSHRARALTKLVEFLGK
jgi:XTP/dITP diphosphohydrolase